MTVPPAAPLSLIVVGYWEGPYASPSLPNVTRFVDPSWDEDERDTVQHYVKSGTIAAACMGYSECRFCGIDNGNMDFTDGVYVWPQGLCHYLEAHFVRLPEAFVEHVLHRLQRVESATRELDWWRAAPGFRLSQMGSQLRRTTASTPARCDEHPSGRSAVG